ncbi:hypothetical protein Hanom_Chr14g01274041 [Helianthus anomalus]
MQEQDEEQNPLQCCSPLLFCHLQAVSQHISACTTIHNAYNNDHTYIHTYKFKNR